MSSESKVNVAIIGLGFGAEFIPIYKKHPNANMYGICRRNEDELKKIGEAFGIENRFTDYQEVLNDPAVDFVHINSPIPDHGWMSIDALKAGKNVMCTVPMATTIEECEEITKVEEPFCEDCKCTSNGAAIAPNWQLLSSEETFLNEKNCLYSIRSRYYTSW